MTEAATVSRIPSLLFFLVLVMGGGLAIGFIAAPGAWYAALAKPSFNPPNWIFAPAWITLYFFIAIAGWRTWTAGRNGHEMMLWWAQLSLNFLWPPLFFAAHQIAAALVVIALLWLTIVAFVVACWRIDRTASVIFIPYALWVGFASILNGAIFLLN